MIKILIAEDDKLVRMGLISVMPWKQFNMQVVGEAKNGKEALKFLESNEVDCLLTDLAMPVMSGIELMQVVRNQYPSVHIVVLTFHQEFEYIQEALRLGVIDYIAKVELEKEQFEEVLNRLHILITGKVNKSSSIFEQSETFLSDLGYVLLSTEDHANLQWLNQTSKALTNSCYEIGDSIFFWMPENDLKQGKYMDVLSKAVFQKKSWMMIEMRGIKSKDRLDVYRKLRTYRKKDLFYEYDENNNIISKSFNEFEYAAQKISDDEFTLLKDRWLSLHWVNEDALYLELRNELKNRRLSIEKLHRMILEITAAWNEIYGLIASSLLIVPESMKSWQEMERWFIDARKTVAHYSVNSRYSQEVVSCVLSAVKIVQEELNQPIFAVNVAKRVNMSRSYFSQCFKDIIGCSFNDYLRNLRIKKAKNYLLNTNKSIQWIAEYTGYSDEKYFSRVFRQQTAMTPSDYRQTNNR